MRNTARWDWHAHIGFATFGVSPAYASRTKKCSVVTLHEMTRITIKWLPYA